MKDVKPWEMNIFNVFYWRILRAGIKMVRRDDDRQTRYLDSGYCLDRVTSSDVDREVIQNNFS